VCVCLPACLSVCLSVSVCLCLSVSVCLPACLLSHIEQYHSMVLASVWLSACLSVSVCLCLSVCVFAYLPVCLPVCLPICLSVSVCPWDRDRCCFVLPWILRKFIVFPNTTNFLRSDRMLFYSAFTSTLCFLWGHLFLFSDTAVVHS